LARIDVGYFKAYRQLDYYKDRVKLEKHKPVQTRYEFILMYYLSSWATIAPTMIGDPNRPGSYRQIGKDQVVTSCGQLAQLLNDFFASDSRSVWLKPHNEDSVRRALKALEKRGAIRVQSAELGLVITIMTHSLFDGLEIQERGGGAELSAGEASVKRVQSADVLRIKKKKEKINNKEVAEEHFGPILEATYDEHPDIIQDGALLAATADEKDIFLNDLEKWVLEGWKGLYKAKQGVDYHFPRGKYGLIRKLIAMSHFDGFDVRQNISQLAIAYLENNKPFYLRVKHDFEYLIIDNYELKGEVREKRKKGIF
jgi:hypothetical protein